MVTWLPARQSAAKCPPYTLPIQPGGGGLVPGLALANVQAQLPETPGTGLTTDLVLVLALAGCQFKLNN